MNPQVQEQEQANEQQHVNGVADEQFQQAQQKQPEASGHLDMAMDETERRARERLITQEADFKHKQKLALLFARSGCFADIKGQTAEQSIAQAFVKITLGESMGFSEAESMSGISLINGTPAVSAQLRAARMQRSGFSWVIDWFEESGTCTGCRLWLYRDGKPLMKPKRNLDGSFVVKEGKIVEEQVNVSFLKADAEKLRTKIWEGPQGKRTSREASVLEKDNWKNTPKNMYFARAVTNAQRWHAPGVLSGDIPSIEEAMDFDTPAPMAAPADNMPRRKSGPAEQGELVPAS